MVETVLFCLQSGHPRRKHVQCTARRRADTFMYAGPRAQYKLVQLLHIAVMLSEKPPKKPEVTREGGCGDRSFKTFLEQRSLKLIRHDRP